MNRKLTLIWALAAVSTAAVAQVPRADFSAMQKALQTAPQNAWLKEAQPVMASAASMQLTERISPSMIADDAPFSFSDLHIVAAEAPSFGELAGKASPATSTPRTVAPKATGTVKTGTLISTDLNYQNQTYHYRIRLEADSTAGQYTFTGIYGQTTPIKASIDAAAGTVTIPYQMIGTSGKDTVMICPMYFNGTQISYGKTDITGTIDAEGIISLPGWGLLITEGANAGRGYNFFTSSAWKPANVQVTAKNALAENEEISYGCYMEQTSDNSVTFYGLSGVTCETITARINSRQQVVVPNSFVYSNLMYGDFYMFPVKENGKADPGQNLIGTGTAAGTSVNFPMWAIASRQYPTLYVGYVYGDVRLISDLAIKWPATPDFKGEGKGTEDSPYIIKTLAEYQTVAAAIAEGNSYEGAYFKLGADIDLTSASESAYVPLGDATTPFNGNFDGAGFTIRNLTVSSTSFTEFGLFGSIGPKGIVKNLKAENIRVSSQGSYTGVIAGWCEGTIEDVTVTGSIVIMNGEMAAGIAGGLKDGTIRNSSFQGALQGNGSVAGIAGQSHNATIADCQVRANVTHRLYFASTAHDAGGIVGAASKTTISGCSATGAITDQDGYAASGGLVGRLISESVMVECFTTMSIQATANPSVGSTTGTAINCYQGGLCGYAISTKDIRDCYSASYVYQNARAAAEYAGGLVGYMGCIYSYSSSDGNKMYDYPVFHNCYYSGQVYSASTLAHKSMYGSTFLSTSWTGPQPYELAFVNCYYDNQIAMYSGDEWGRPTSFFTTSLPQGFDASVWKAQAGHYPVLAKYADNQVAQLASAALILADGQDVNKVSKNFTVTPETNVTWAIASGENLVTSTDALAISGSTVTIRNEYDNALVVATSSDGWGIKYYRLAIVPKWFQGDGTESSPFRLSTSADFEKLNTAVSNYGQGHIGDFFEVTADIDFANSSFEGIGTGSGYSFGGVIDGKNHKLSNLSIDVLAVNNDSINTAASKMYAGVVGILGYTGVIRNLNIDKSCSFRGYGYLGSIAGATMGRIENCRNYAPVAASHAYVGGITGYSVNSTDDLGNPTNNAAVINCYNSGNVSGGTTTIGGIVGQNYSLIQLCQNDGDVSGSSIVANTVSFNTNTVGGIAGYHYSMATTSTALIDRCVNNGSIAANWGVGGITGYISMGSITNCINSGLVTSLADDIRRGGIIGQYNSRTNVENNYYDASININGGSNNAGLGGINGLSSAQLTAGNALAGLDTKDFDFTAKMYPVLTAFKDETASAALRSMVVYFPEGVVRSNVTKPVDLSAGTTWKLTNDQAFKINGSVLSVTLPEGNSVPTDTISGTKDIYKKVFALAAVPAILKGEGSEASPFLIETPEDWNKLSDFMLETKYEYPGTYFRMVNNLDFKNDSIKLLAVNGVKFNGTFDGNGKTVSNFVYNNFNSSTTASTWKGPNLYRGANIGLFGTLGAEGTIKNLTSNGDFHAYTMLGGIVGEVYGIVDNCHHKGTVSTVVTLANGNAGGSNLLGGIAYKIFDGGQIINCTNSGKVISKSTYPAGIVCRTVDNTLVENCVNTGTVEATTTSACGIVYECGGTIRNSGNKGALKCTGTAIGVCYSLLKTGKLESCYNEADIDLDENGTTVSGIVYNTADNTTVFDDDVTPEHTSWLKGCWNTGNLTAKATVTGIAGNIKKGVLVENCWNTGNITAKTTNASFGISAAVTANDQTKGNYLPTVLRNCWNSGTITSNTVASAVASGLVKTTQYATVMEGCYNLGDVIILSKPTTSSQICCASGLVNQISGGTFIDCWNAGNIKAQTPCNGGIAGYVSGATLVDGCFNLGNIEGSSLYDNKGTMTAGNTNGTAGGLFGYFTSVGEPKITNCYNAGNVSGNNRVGGISGGMFKNTKVVLENIYNSGKVTCENNWWSATVYTNIEDPSPYYANWKNLYFDATVNPGEEYSSYPESGKTTSELCALNLGDGFLNGYGYPYLASFFGSSIAQVPYGVAGISTAVVIPANGDALDNINNFVTLGSTDAVTWKAEPVGDYGGNLEILEGQGRPSKKGAVKLTASSLDGKYVREFNLVINTVVSGLENVNAAKAVKSMLFVDVQGRIIPAPVAGQPYVVRITFTDGTSEVRRMISHK